MNSESNRFGLYLTVTEYYYSKLGPCNWQQLPHANNEFQMGACEYMSIRYSITSETSFTRT